MDDFCLICFNKIDKYSLRKLVERKIYCCDNCLKEMNLHLTKLCIDGVKGIGIYQYNDVLRKLIYQFKGCKDYELKDVFIKQYRWLFKLFFHNCIFVPIPSYKKADEKRGFNHVEEILKTIGVRYVKCIDKTKNIKQSSLSKKKRKDVGQYLSLNDKSWLLEGKRVVLFDDVLTTGATLSACIKLIKTLKIRDIFFVVLSVASR